MDAINHGHDIFDFIALMLIPFVAIMVPIALYLVANRHSWRESVDKRLSELEKWRAAVTGETN